MKVKATATSGKDLSEKSLEAFHNPEEDFQLNIGEIYTVYGISLWEGLVHYLAVDPQIDRPYWYHRV